MRTTLLVALALTVVGAAIYRSVTAADACTAKIVDARRVSDWAVYRKLLVITCDITE